MNGVGEGNYWSKDEKPPPRPLPQSRGPLPRPKATKVTKKIQTVFFVNVIALSPTPLKFLAPPPPPPHSDPIYLKQGGMKKKIYLLIFRFFRRGGRPFPGAGGGEPGGEKEKAAGQASKDKKAEDFKKVVAADFIGVYAEGVSNMQKEMSDMQKWDMKSFAISDYTAASDEKDTIITTYTVKIEGV